MSLKGSQRGGAKALDTHLLRLDENDHVEVHELRGFLSSDVTGACKETQAIAKGTKCRQFFFSLSLSPPQNISADIPTFESAIEQAEAQLGLTGQPRAVIFHEKAGRRHAHVVWSRIDAETMTAVNLPFFKTKLRDLSRALFLEHGWKMPRGLMNSAARSPTNVTLAEWQQAKRRGRNAIDQKMVIQECWAVSDSRSGFSQALAERGYILAQGDRRGFVAVTHDGEVLAIARATDQRVNAVRQRLGEPDDLPSVDEAKAMHRRDVTGHFQRMAGEARAGISQDRTELDKQRDTMVSRHRKERAALDNGQTARWHKESLNRAARLRSGLSGIWQQITGKYRKLQAENQHAAYDALQRDRAQRQRMIDAQLAGKPPAEAAFV